MDDQQKQQEGKHHGSTLLQTENNCQRIQNIRHFKSSLRLPRPKLRTYVLRTFIEPPPLLDKPSFLKASASRKLNPG